MAKKAKILHTKKGVELKIVNPNAAGIDIADTEMQVCVPVDRDGDNNRRFGSFTRDLNEICEWLVDCGIDTAAMEATGIYWIPLFFKLKESGIDVILVDTPAPLADMSTVIESMVSTGRTGCEQAATAMAAATKGKIRFILL